MRQLALVFVVLSMTVISSAALGDTPKNKGPEIIRLKMGDLELPFKHWKHQTNLNNECYHCHSTKIGKIDGWGKEAAHRVCIACHDLDDKGPVTCHQCHDK
jgi:hypothetical protein